MITIRGSRIRSGWHIGLLGCVVTALLCFSFIIPLPNSHEVFFLNGQAGLKNAEGKVLLPPLYKSITFTRDTVVEIGTFPEWHILGEKGKEARSFFADSIQPRSFQSVSLFRNGVEIVVDSVDRPIFSEEQTLERLLNNNAGIVRHNGKIGVIKVSGRELIPFQYDSIALSGEFYYCLAKKSKPQWDIYNRFGRKINERQYQDVITVPQNLIPVQRNGYWGYMNFDGQLIIDPKFDDATPFVEGVAKVRYLEGDGVINKQGEWLIPPFQARLNMITPNLFLNKFGDRNDLLNEKGEIIYQTYNALEVEEFGVLEKTEEGKIGLISLNGNMVVAPEYDLVTPIDDGKLILLKNEEVVRAINHQGDAIIGSEIIYQDIISLNEDYVSIKKDGRFGFVDLSDNLRISNRYEGVGDFNNGVAAIKLRGKWGFIDKQDRLKIQPRYDEVEPFLDMITTVRIGDYYGMISPNGEVLVPVEMDSIEATAGHHYIAHQSGKMGVVNRYGEMLISPKYEAVEVTSSGLVIANYRGEFGILKSNGNNLTPFSFSDLKYDEGSDVFYALVAAPSSKSISLGQLR